MGEDAEALRLLAPEGRVEHHYYLSPQRLSGTERPSATLLRSGSGRTVRCRDIAKMVPHRAGKSSFYELGLLPRPSDVGFKVVRHPLPANSASRSALIATCRRAFVTCVLMVVRELVIRSHSQHPKRSRWRCLSGEMRVQAMQNQVFIAMCNRVGTEGDMDFAGEIAGNSSQRHRAEKGGRYRTVTHLRY